MNSLSNEIIALLNKRQEVAFEVVFHLYYPRLVWFAQNYISVEDAKGLVQEAFITLWEKNPGVSNESQLQSYLYTTVKNNCLMFLRHKNVAKNFVQKAEIKIHEQLNAAALEQLDTSEIAFREMETIIEKTIAGLSPRCREVFVLSRMEGKKNKKIAEELNISVKAVEAQMTKALGILKMALKDFLPVLAWWLGISP
ncbi:MAG: RNA polymerase sigma-70 factor [Bacteroidales bacterium]